MKASCCNAMLLCGVFIFLYACLSARANVYATDIQINGSLQSGVLVHSGSATISYILNDNATAGVSVQIYRGSQVVKTFAGGTNTGLNTVVWDGKSDEGILVKPGPYNVSITAAATGYATWTNISDDGANFDVFFPTSITVNKNTNSPYYGRVFIGNGEDGGGMTNGILKYNADGSAADEGGFGTGGYSWSGNGQNFANPSPWKMDVGSDDRLYVDDWSGNGVVVSFDQVLSTHYFSVLRPDNYPYPDILLSGLSMCGEGTNMQIYMADFNSVDPENPDNYGSGILSWTLGTNEVAAYYDTGTEDVASGGDSDLTSPYAVSVDTNGNIYTIQWFIGPWDLNPNPKVLCFPPAPIGGPPDTQSLWEIGGYDPTLVNTYGVAADPTATFVAVASRGYGNDSTALQDGGVSIFLATNGSLVTNIQQNAEGETNQEFFDVAWDNAGNLYTVYGYGLAQEGWRIYSPPGSNQTTTVGVPVLQVFNRINPPHLLNPTNAMGQMSFTLKGQSYVTYVVQQSPDLSNWTAVATNYSSNNIRTVSIRPSGAQAFYRAVTSP